MKEILSENSNQVLKDEVQEYLRTILKVDFRITESEDNLKRGLQSLFLSKTGQGKYQESASAEKAAE